MTTVKSNRLAKISFALLFAILFSLLMATGASASNQDGPFKFTTKNSSSQGIINAGQRKENASSIYCYIKRTQDSSVTYAYVNARGSYSSSTANESSWAWCNSAEPTNRRMNVGTQYFIYNSVYEAGYPYAALSFKTFKPVTMSGVWSPDSVYQSGVVQI